MSSSVATSLPLVGTLSPNDPKTRFGILCVCVALFQEGTPLMRDIAMTAVAGSAIFRIWEAMKG